MYRVFDMKTMSISLHENLYERLKHAVPSKRVSHFVSNAISHELDNIEGKLEVAYQEAKKDKERNGLLMEWDAIEDFDGK